MRTRIVPLALWLTTLGCISSDAAVLKVAPVSLSVAASAAATTMRLTNAAERKADIQVRVFRWTQEEGKDRLVPTRDVVVSPPLVNLAPRQQQTIRVVRIAKHPVVDEESYRILVDILPQRGAVRSGTVSFLLRYSVPLFFEGNKPATPDLAWSVRYDRDRYLLSAANRGAARVKIAGITLRDAAGTDRPLAQGLVGYVLGESSMTWPIKSKQVGAPAPGPATLRYRSDTGTVDVPVDLHLGN